MSDISLPYGVDAEGRFAHISQVNSGATQLRCPYCAGLLTAKKGNVLAHHFAHTDETCLTVAERDFESLTVPAYDRFNLHIKADVWEKLVDYHDGISSLYTYSLLHHDPPLLKEVYYPRTHYELTHEGGLPFGEVTLEWFADFQLKAVERRHRDLSWTVEKANYGDGRSKPAPHMVPVNLIDLNIYRAQVGRLFGLHLYLLKITYEDGVLYKIGVTSRDVEARIVEIERALIPVVKVKSIKVDRLCKNRGAVERYVQHRYRDYQVPMENLTEYFEFDKKTLSTVRREFTKLGDLNYERIFTHGYWQDGKYVPEQLIGEILAGEPSYIEQKIQQEEYKRQHAAATKAGIEMAKEKGIHVGRPADSAHEILEKYPEIVEALNKGHTLKQIAREIGVSRNTVRRVKAAMSGWST